MSKLKLVLLIVAFMFVSTQSHASSQILNKIQIKTAIEGKRILLATKYGVEFPLVYNQNGTVYGDGTGTGLGKFFAPKQTGKWWVSGNKLCQQFKTWYKGKRLCFTLEKTSEKTLIWRQDNGDFGKAKISN